MNNKVNVECPHCGYVVTMSVPDLVPGMWYECFNCQQKTRFTSQDIKHLLEALKQRK